DGNQDSTVDDSSGDNTAETTKPKKAPAVEAALPEYVSYGQWTSAEGKWTFADSNGEVYKNKWAAVVNPYAKKEAGQSVFDWFFFDVNGHMMTGWIFEGGRWYYLNPVSDGTQGRMMTGWQLIDGKWYYLNTVSDGTKGAMLADAWIDGYYVDANGVWDATKTK
ncbi:MAG: peptidase A26, partial [Lachnospiraceae bacterium]|nr:peptidase A26 [Lachnospiraceae bacterium]